MNEIQKVNEQLPKLKIWNGKRVVTFRDIDEVHQRTHGTASRNFKTNKKHFIEGIDYFLITREDVNRRNSSIDKNSSTNILHVGNIPPKGITLITESGYLMITKSFTDDLAWEVQRRLVNNYFQIQSQQLQPALPRQETYLLRNSPTWFQRNNSKMKMICDYFYWTRKHLYHKILQEVSDIYSLENVEELFISDYGKRPFYKMDLIEYYPPLQEVANSYIDHLMNFIEE